MSFFKNQLFLYRYIFILLLFLGCKKSHISEKLTRKITPLFSIVPRETSNIDFRNDLPETLYMNGLFYEYYYNGGGVAVGDFNNDKFPDIYFISNLKPNKMYLNKRGMKFEDITVKAGVMGKAVFPTGVTTVDINSDGWLDIYVCSSGKFEDSDKRRNELYINKGLDADGIPWFEESGKAYGLDIEDFSTQAAFFDFDKDGDLDMFLINHDVAIYGDDKLEKYLHTEGKLSGERLYRNDNGKFVNITNESGIINNRLGFGLGLAIGDVNNDSWPDIYVSHDFSGEDHLYINNKNGTFSEHISQSMGHISNFSMGNDMVDYNNDGWLDIMTVDMVSEDNYGIKTSMSGMNPEKFRQLVDLGLHHQYMFNTLQLNNGTTEKDGIPYFSEVAHLAGVSNTDWSWAPLFFDMNNDGFQDLFIANGIKRDFRNNDFVNYHKKIRKKLSKNKSIDKEAYINHMISIMPTRKKNNYFFLNDGNLSFHKMNKEWGLDSILTCSNGASYADFDNDGDIDIVVNNMDDYACLYKNNTLQSEDNNYLKISLKGAEGNLLGIGARITITYDGKKQIREQYLTRGFQSSISEVLHFGLGNTKRVTIEVIWPDLKKQIIRNVDANQLLTIDYKNAEIFTENNKVSNTLFIREDIKGLKIKHQENYFDDFEREGLLPHKMSQEGPSLAIGDINGDGLDDIHIGNALGKEGKILQQQKDGSFLESNISIMKKDAIYEDTFSSFIDIDGDKDLDLYIVSGGNEHTKYSPLLKDRLYLNDGRGNFTDFSMALPNIAVSGSCVKAADYDKDGDLDLFIGGRQVPGRYPNPAKSYILVNKSVGSKIHFDVLDSPISSQFDTLGMVTDAIWIDINKDKYLDLVVTGEWMPIMVFENTKNGDFKDKTIEYGFKNTNGWWYCLSAADFDKDGDLDIVAGNLGLNYKYRASQENPFEVFAADFDKTGTYNIVLSYYDKNILVPLRGRECSSNQMPFIKKKFPTYDAFAKAKLRDVFDENQLKKSIHLQAYTFSTSIFINEKGRFKQQTLPDACQLSSVNDILIDDFNDDNNMDIIMAGNLYNSEVETPRNDASYGVVLLGNGKGDFKELPSGKSGLMLRGEIRHIQPITINGTKKIVIIKNNDSLEVLKKR